MEGAQEWSVTVRPDDRITVITTIRFTRAGEFTLRAVACDPLTGRVAESGEHILINRETGAFQTQSTGWVRVITQTFEGTFPSAGWTVRDLSNDDYTRYWDADDYRPHWGNRAAWPARGGKHGRDPLPGNDDYFNI